ncbi:MAG: hotdog fold thioesterase [Rhodospirillaceae bacterium]|nr:hotdog fold thioesterase [Rhodospirillales bacterium]MBT6406940.1 hotdog fold thioesterase [Rhodospirillaceae bacterium]
MSETTSATNEAQRVAAWMVERDRLVQSLGITLDNIGDGFATARMRVNETMLNSFAMGHGGALFAVADAAFSYACNAGNRKSVAVHCTIDYLAATEEGDRLTAIAQLTARTGRNAIFDVPVTNEQGVTVVLFRGVARQIGGSVLPECGEK